MHFRSSDLPRYSFALALLLPVLPVLPLAAQVSTSIDIFPYQQFSNPEEGLEESELFSRAIRLEISFPFVLAEERTQLDVGLSYERRQFSYRNFPSGDPDINDIHAGGISVTLQQRFSEKWSVMATVTPGLASDLEGDLTIDDLNFQSVLAFIRTVNPKFAYGVGAVYSTEFGEPIPLPVLMFDWNNGGKLSWMTILPIGSEFWYAPSERVHLGLLLGVGGNKYQGDPDLFAVDDPEMRYSVVTIGPSARLAVSRAFLLQVDAGIIGYHRFEFYDGNDKISTFNLKPSLFLRAGIRFLGG